MKCNRYREWLSAEIDGMLDERQTRLLREHLAACPACRRAKTDLEKTVALIRALPEMAPPHDLPDSVQQRIAAEPKIGWTAWRLLTMPLTRVVLAAALLLIVVIYGYRPLTSVTRDVESAKTGGQKAGGGKELEYAQAKDAELVPTLDAGKPSGPEPAKRAKASAGVEAPSASLKAKTAPWATEADGASAADNYKYINSKTGEGGHDARRGRQDAVPPKEEQAAVRSKDADAAPAADNIHGGGAPWLQEQTVAAPPRLQRLERSDGGQVSRGESSSYPVSGLDSKKASESGMAETRKAPMKVATLSETESCETKIWLAEEGEKQKFLKMDMKPKDDVEKETQVARAEKPGAGGRKAEAPAPGGEGSVKLRVVTANPAAVVRLLESYRQQQPLDKAMVEQYDAAVGSGADRQGAGEKKREEQASARRDQLQARGQAGQTSDPLMTVWVPARAYSELLKKIRDVGEITEDNKPPAKARSDGADLQAGADQSAELIAVQVRIIRAGRE